MGPQTNNIQSNMINSSIFTSEQLGLSPNLSQKQPRKKTPLLFLAFLVITIVLIISLVFFTLIKPKKEGSGKLEDLAQFMKLYQYGDINSKKDINLNIPTQQTYAYKLLTSNDSSEKILEYGESLYSAYKKYGNQKKILEYLFLYKNYMSLSANIQELRRNFPRNGEEASKKFIEKSIAGSTNLQFTTTKTNFSKIQEYYNKELEYMLQLKKMGCIKDQTVAYDCESKIYQIPNQYPEASTVAKSLIELGGENDQNSITTTQILNDLLIEHYKTKAMNKESKNGKKK